MKRVKGSKTLEINKQEFIEISHKYTKLLVDIGTGDGRYVYKNAILNPQNLYIGIDPNQKQLETYSKKANKNKVENCIFIIGSIEIPIPELYKSADEISIIFPWGTLLKAIATRETHLLKNIRDMLKDHGKLVIIFGYEKDFEPTEYERLALTEVNPEEIRSELSKFFSNSNVTLDLINTKEMKEIESTWGKKLSFNPYRKIHKLEITI